MMIEPLTEAKLEALFGPNPTQVRGSAGVIDGDKAGNKNDVIHGEGDNHTLRGHSGNDFLHAGAASYQYSYEDSEGVEHDNTRYGDYEDGASIDDDKLYGGEGNDVLVGGRENDLLDGGSGDDYLIGDVLVLDEIRGTGLSTEPSYVTGHGTDVLIGGSGNDYLHSGGGVNILNGGPGDDTLVSRGYSDVLIGGPGRDTFDVDDEYFPVVKITDFQDGYDQIHIDSDSAIVALYHMVTQANMQWDWEWFATDLEDGVFIPVEEGGGIMINGVDPADLAFQFVGDDVFIV